MLVRIVAIAFWLFPPLVGGTDIGNYFTHAWDQVRSPFGTQPRTILVSSKGPAADATYIQQLAVEGPDGFSTSLAAVIGKGETEPMTFALPGQSSKRPLAVLKAMDIVNGERKLPLLQFLFVGGDRDAQEARQVVEGWGSTFVFLSHSDYAGTSERRAVATR